MNHTEFINKLEELSHVIQGTPFSKWDLFWSNAVVVTTIILVALILGGLTVVPLIAMHSAVTDEIKDSGDSSNTPLWFLSMSLALVFSLTTGAMAWCIGQEFVSSVVSHEKELQQRYDLYQQTSTDLYNQLVYMNDDEFTGLSSASSKYELTREQVYKYKHVIKEIKKVDKMKSNTK